MKTALSILTLTIVATAALAQKHFVGFDGAVAGAGEATAGSALFDGEVGDAVAVDAKGILVVVAGDAIAVGDAIEVGAGGTAVPRTTGVIVGYALSAAAAGDMVQVLA